MSRSWERKVQKNQSQLNKQRKKEGKKPLSIGSSAASAEPAVETFKGRSFIFPIFLLMFIGFYISVTLRSAVYAQTGAMFWVTIACYVLLAVLFFFRRPYLSIGKEFIRSRRFTGDKSLYKVAIKAIVVKRGYVIIEQQKGGNWVFAQATNRFPTDQMSEPLRIFAANNGIPFVEK
ncbi:hypothetical protein K0T92_23105 [Paenibacillus oenotherae]|uniref:Methyltransferase n=1 Tax=Paenibacillus oenotherae TaxID=1435645 RepID=A0ABS7DD11_9BACL|nr:hypothetical protein [Paenibacillus oenotherae]MBW7477613.1 hypothetical protein [Paenibacillus oenotherae]